MENPTKRKKDVRAHSVLGIEVDLHHPVVVAGEVKSLADVLEEIKRNRDFEHDIEQWREVK